MSKAVVQVQLRNVLEMDQGHAVFLGNDEKTFVIFVDESVGKAIAMTMRGHIAERPLTHELLNHVLRAFGAKVERVVINHHDSGVYFARLILSAENEIQHRKMVELDARPSDSIALAIAHSAPIYVLESVWDDVEDVSEALEEIQNQTQDDDEDDDY